MNEKDKKLNNRIVSNLSIISSYLDRPGFIDPVLIEKVLSDLKSLRNDANNRSRKVLYGIGIVNKELKGNVEEFIRQYDSFRENAIKHNNRIISERIEEISKRINPVEGRNLDEQQLSSIAYDIKTRLVIAGAGTGKTTTIIGLVKEILMTDAAQSDEILLLSFTNNSVKELQQRIVDETGQNIDTRTFHSLGMNIIKTADGTTPKITSVDLERFISEEIERKKTDKSYLKALNRFLAYDFDSQKNESDFNSYSEYAQYLEENPLITINGEKVKSFGEGDIANFLAINGIPYQYEESYPIDTNNTQYGQYHPDFHITGTDIYIEYYGIDRNGKVAKFMIDDNPNASEDYQKGMEWKREIHRSNNTRLIELYAYNRLEGELQSELESKLRKMNVEFNPDSQTDALCNTLSKDDRMMNSIVSMIKTLILLIKGHGDRWENVFPQGKNRGQKKQYDRLENVAKPLFDAYQKHLRDHGEIDFEDMLNLARYIVLKGGYDHPYKYVIVDEYQDLSLSRYNLLKSLRDTKDFKLFCVGDDWQSIYRFNGSDVSYILNFKDYWGPAGICKIETTYRFSGDLLRISSDFVCRNKRQYPKQLVGKGKENCSVNPLCAKSVNDARMMLARIINTIPEGKTVLFLGRYKHDVRLLSEDGFSWKPDIANSSSMIIKYSGRPDLSMKYLTIHGSKGLQSDYVFSLNNKTGEYGFPSMREEHPVITSLFGGRNTQMDEERRLFYVAMTRARNSVYLLTYRGQESDFYKELFGSTPIMEDYGRCPVCGGKLRLKEGRYGQFYGCSNYRSKGCKYTRNYFSSDNH